MARRYTRDNRGRFASAGSGATARGGRLKTAGGNKRQTQTMTAKAAPKGIVGKPRGLKPDAAISSRLKMRDKTSALGKIAQRREFQASMRKVASQVTPAPSKPRVKAGRPTGVIKGTDKMNTHAFITKAGQNKAARAQSKALRAKPAANSIRRTGRKAPRNNVKPYRPVTPDGQMGRSERKIDRSMKQLVDSAGSIRQTLNARKPQIDKFDRQLQRMNAKAIADRLKKGIRGELAGMELRIMGGKSGRKAIQRRMGRAAEAAARGSKPAAKAQQIYANQLAFMGSGKAKAGRNNFRPGPRNTTGTPKRKPKRKK